MISLITVSSTHARLANDLRQHRVNKGFTQSGLAKRAGVSIATLRKFEQTGFISLESFLKIAMVLGLLEKIVNAISVVTSEFHTIDEVLQASKKRTRKRGWRE